MSNETTDDRSPISDAAHKSGGVVLFGSTFIVIGILIIPPVFDTILATGDPIESSGIRMVAWITGILLICLGVLFLIFRKRLQLGNVLLTFFSLAMALSIVEAVLHVVGIPPLAPIMLRIPEVAPYWSVSEDEGGRFVGQGYKEDWHINTQGFSDIDEFASVSLEGTSKRVMLLGDSFSFGAQASTQDQTFASILERELGEGGCVWNMGIPGSGEKQALVSLREFGSVLKPHVVVLQFYENDYTENLYPPGIHYLFENGQWVNRYVLQPDGSVITLDPDQAYRRAFGSPSLVSILKSSRIISSVVRIALARTDTTNNSEELDIEPTRTALVEVKAECEDLDAELLVFLIPARGDLEKPTETYMKSIALFRELEIDYIDIRENLSESDYAAKPDIHWNDSGHQKGGGIIVERVNHIFSKHN